jgi:hypothetical protein
MSTLSSETISVASKNLLLSNGLSMSAMRCRHLLFNGRPIGYRRWSQSHLNLPDCRETSLKPARACHTMRHPTILSSCRRLTRQGPR